MIHDLVGYFAALCTTGALIPQVEKAYRTKHTRDLAYGMYGLNGIGVATWLVYGWLMNDIPLIIANAITLILVLSVLALKIRNGD